MVCSKCSKVNTWKSVETIKLIEGKMYTITELELKKIHCIRYDLTILNIYVY